MIVVRETTRDRHDVEEFRLMNFFLTHAAESRGQLLQDLWVAFETGERQGGYFVEFGATDGVKFSNTYYLETKLGWTGVLAEPARLWHESLRQNRRCAIDTRCVWTETGHRVVFNEAKIPAHSTIDIYSGADNLADTRLDGEKYEVETISLNDLLEEAKAPRKIDYLSIDTEGSEFDILAAFDFRAHDIQLITVEHNYTPKRDDLHRLLSAKGYTRKFPNLSHVDDWYSKIG
jgi:FkbM family methyltransferase